MSNSVRAPRSSPDPGPPLRHTMPAQQPNPTPTPPSDLLLAKNLHALSIRSPLAAAAVARCTAPCDVQLHRAPNGQLTGLYQSRQLASLHDPGQEAKRFSRAIDLDATACAVILGFGVGHHVADLSRRLRGAGLVVVFEPDLPLLREVLSRTDYADLFLRGNVVLFTDPSDTAAIASAISGSEGLLAIGTKLLTHPPSKARLGQSANDFGAAFAHVMKAVRTHVLTTLVQVEATVRNQLQNLDHYATCPGLNDLHNAAQGKPAIVISAGPSLARNLHLLEDASIRDRFVLIAVQTVLKPLLDRGIRPHFVTALDHHEISKRFYEGLTPRDVEGITLVAEAKSNPAILDAFPGNIRCPADPLLDRILGSALASPHAALKPGATVAHLAYYLARFLGCDPVILVGQDLAFTDGQYYSKHAAIHQVWSSELSEFRTLEMFEWERIARMKHLLRPNEDVLGRKVYTDEQMSTYLVQFERDFADDAQLNLRTIDATEGGVRKRHTQILTLEEALRQHQCSQPLQLPATPPATPDRARRLAQVRDHLRAVQADAESISKQSKLAVDLLGEAKSKLDQPHEADAHIQRVHEIRDDVTSRATAYHLAHFLNQAGTLNRFKADRLLQLDKDADDATKLRRQLDRDITNVTWLADSASHAARLLESAANSLDGKPKVTRDVQEPACELHVSTSRKRVIAIVLADTLRSALDTPRDLLRPVAPGLSALALTLCRLARSRELDAIVLATDAPALLLHEVEQARTLFARRDLPISIAPIEPALLRHNARPIAISRLFARDSWRGGLASLSVYDEPLRPSAALSILHHCSADAVAMIGADWSLVDPILLDAAIARYREQSERNSLTFVQAPPGLGACVIDREILTEWARVGGPYATVGAMLAYLPAAPQSDPIAKPACITVPAHIRDLPVRLIADDPDFFEHILPLLPRAADALIRLTSDQLAASINHQPIPRHLHNLALNLGGQSSSFLSVPDFDRILHAIPRTASTTLTLSADTDPLLHPDWTALLARAKASTFAAIHLRTPLWADPVIVESLLAAGLDIISIDTHSASDETYRALTGRALGDLARANLELLLTLRDSAPSLIPTPYVVPRLTRRDAVYDEIEPFYERALLRSAAAVLDPLPHALAHERIAPLPLPPSAVARLDATCLHINSQLVLTRPSGTLVAHLADPHLLSLLSSSNDLIADAA